MNKGIASSSSMPSKAAETSIAYSSYCGACSQKDVIENMKKCKRCKITVHKSCIMKVTGKIPFHSIPYHNTLFHGV